MYDRIKLTDSPRPYPTGLTPDRDDLPRTILEQRESDPFAQSGTGLPPGVPAATASSVPSSQFRVPKLTFSATFNPKLETTTVENVGHAPQLDEPDAWDAVLDFLAKVE